ncbi:hypothetical protein ACFQV2_11680 [Actinokineospora soli]|uniref:Uncharacterized protein n=1 Tax=Actinokineospora soli TaxID=1048753 RepID=A0ABW2TM57_9PSEU
MLPIPATSSLAECPALDGGSVDVVVTVANEDASRPFTIAVTSPTPNWALLGGVESEVERYRATGLGDDRPTPYA